MSTWRLSYFGQIIRRQLNAAGKREDQIREGMTPERKVQPYVYAQQNCRGQDLLQITCYGTHELGQFNIT